MEWGLGVGYGREERQEGKKEKEKGHCYMTMGHEI
jgi:hypothetical protein